MKQILRKEIDRKIELDRLSGYGTNNISGFELIKNHFIEKDILTKDEFILIVTSFGDEDSFLTGITFDDWNGNDITLIWIDTFLECLDNHLTNEEIINDGDISLKLVTQFYHYKAIQDKLKRYPGYQLWVYQ